jgi:hypothetical protein
MPENADTPTRRHADTPTRRHADTPTRRHADIADIADSADNASQRRSSVIGFDPSSLLAIGY